MRFKDSTINPFGISNELFLGLVIADQVWRENNQHLVITSLNDSKHEAGSLHYSGNAADLRIWGFNDVDSIANLLRSSLNEDYDVVVEKDHIHLEYQPKVSTARRF